MTPNDNTQDEELLARYRQASADAAGPSDAVREAILAESRRVAADLAKQAPQFDVSSPAANDSRWKIKAYGTVGVALLAALLFAPRYWENAPTAQVSMAPAPAPAPATTPASAPAPSPKSEDVKSYTARTNAVTARQSPSDSNSLQEIIVTQADRRSSKSAGAPSLNPPVPAPNPPPSAAQNYAPVSPSVSRLADAPPAAAARVRPLDLSARAAESGAVSVTGGLPSADSALKPATLQSAAAQGDVAQATALLDQGAVIDARDEAGRTPLMLAVTQGRLEIVRLLLARGADPNAADNTGRTPLQQARLQNSREIAALLEGWQRARSAQ
jgi:ankyrin repeat protein